ncbi:MAG: 5-formyltetrahydrofolate cyclo-ligase [Gammaproteobacteria bacterium]|nr:MAG: 5-formyltetrahydrofolate cyclo-ligase [Gammaproteobacteria bacterium]
MSAELPDPAVLRRHLRTLRAELPVHEQQAHSERAARLVVESRSFRAARRLAAYVADRGEIDPLPIVLAAWEQQRQVYLPVLSPNGDQRLWFARYRPDAPMRRNRYGIPEPVWGRHDLIPAQALDLVLMPLVAFDRHGHRLGMGGGWYDRSFAFRQRRHHWQRPVLAGLAHDFQQVAALPHQPWDVDLDEVFTENRHIIFRRETT